MRTQERVGEMETKRELTYEEQVKGLSFLKDVILHVNQYMSAAIESANHTCHVTDEEFWDHLFLSPSRNKYITVIETQELSRTPCPENPYEHLDFQGCNKYLLFGGNRLQQIFFYPVPDRGARIFEVIIAR